MIEKMNEKDFYKWFGKEFQIIRERKGLKQKDVAVQAEVDPTELSRFENTGKKISAYKILRLLKAINATTEEILGETEKKTYGHSQWRSVVFAGNYKSAYQNAG